MYPKRKCAFGWIQGFQYCKDSNEGKGRGNMNI